MRKATVFLALVFMLATTAISREPRQNGSSAPAKAEALKAVNDSATNLAELEKTHGNTVELFDKVSSLYSALEKKAAEAGKIAAQKNASQAQLMQAIQQMQETQMSFNLQYLQLQNSMQNENRQFTMVSNIMKTKSDTAKNSISNIR